MIEEKQPEPSHARTTIKRIKTIVFGLASGLLYFWIFYYGFGIGALWTSLLFVLLFFVAFHLFYIQISKVSLRYLAGALFFLSIVEWLALWRSNYLLGASVLVINAWIWMLAYYLQGETREKIRFSSWAYFNVGGYIFTVFVTIWYSLLLLGFYDKFPLTCQDLSNASDSVVNFFTRPVTDGAKKITASTTSFWNTKVSDVFNIGNTVSLSTNTATNKSLIQQINTWKKNLIDQALADNSTVSMGICDYVLTQVNKIYNNPAFLTSVVFLLFILLYSFVRIVFWVMTWLAFVIFKVLWRCGLYRVTKVIEEVERIE